MYVCVYGIFIYIYLIFSFWLDLDIYIGLGCFLGGVERIYILNS